MSSLEVVAHALCSEVFAFLDVVSVAKRIEVGAQEFDARSISYGYEMVLSESMSITPGKELFGMSVKRFVVSSSYLTSVFGDESRSAIARSNLEGRW